MDWKFEGTAGRTRRRRYGAVVLGVTLAAGLTGIAAVGAATPSPVPPMVSSDPNVPWDDGATPAEIRTDLVEVGPRTWDHVLFSPDGRTATVYFWMGPPACEGLAAIDTTPTDAGYRILVMTGAVPGAEACPDVVEMNRSEVVLEDRVLTGGELLDLPN